MKQSASRRLDAHRAAAFLTETIGAPISERSLARYSIPYRVILKRKIYEERDLRAWAEAAFASAPRRIGKATTAK